MRTIEEVIEWLGQQELRQSIRPAWLTIEKVLDFIKSDPPCKHPKAFGTSAQTFGLPMKWYVRGLGVGPDVLIKYCPDCGEKLPED